MTTPNDSGSPEGQRGTGGTGGGRWAQYGTVPGPQGPGAYPAVPAPQPPAGQDSFWSALFDFSFTRYATPSIIRFAYALGFAFIALVWVAYVCFVVFGLAHELGAGGLLLGLILAVVVTLGALFALMSMRMMLEFYLSNIRIAQSAQRIEQQTAYRR